MAVKGNFTAFQKLRPTDGLSKDIQFQQNAAFKRRQEDRIEEGIDYQRAQAKKKADKELYDKYIVPYDSIDTGSKTLNARNAQLLISGQQKMGELVQVLRNSEVGSGDYINAKMGLENLKLLPEKIKTFENTRIQQHQQIVKLAEEGKIYKNEAYKQYLKNYQDQATDFKLGLDDQYSPVAAYLDENNNVTDTDSLESAVSGKLPFEAVAVYDFDAKSQELADAAGTFEETTQDGRTTTTTSNPKMRLINNSAKNLFTVDDDGNYSTVAQAAFIEAGVTNRTPEKLEELKNAFIQETLSRIDTEKSVTTKTYKGDNDTDKEATFTERVKASKSTYGEKVSLIAEGAGSVGVSGITIPALKSFKENGDEFFITDAKVENISYTAEGGQMIANVVYQDSKSSTFERKEKNILQLIAESEQKLGVAQAEGDTGAIKKSKKDVEKYNLQLERLKQGGRNTKATVILNREDESFVASRLGGLDAVRGEIFANENNQQEQQEDNDTTQTTFSGGTIR